MPTLGSPLAFELCEGGQCGDPTPDADNKHVSCASSDKCATGACYCELFHRRKGSAETDPWNLAAIDKTKKAKYRPDKQEYKCFCVKPILENETTIDGVKYTVRHILCKCATCSLDAVEVLGQNKHTELKCSGTCEGECKCTLFRLQVTSLGDAAWDPKDAKWELVAKADKQVVLEDHYLYRCFCLK